MKQAIIKVVILVTIFVGSLFGFNFLMGNKQNTMAAEMEEATLPLVALKCEGQTINSLHGYVNDMDAALVSDSITPMEEGQSLTILISPYKNEIKQVYYEITSQDGTSLIEEGTIKEFKEKKQVLQGNLKVQTPLEAEKEYLLKMMVMTNSGRNSSFYTKIIKKEETHIQECLRYVMNFHKVIFDKEKAVEIQKNLETKEELVHNTLAKVNINSTFDLITWGSLKPKVLGSVIPTVKEVTEDTCVVELFYTISAENKKGVPELYHVVEYYRVKWSADRMYLLEYERTQEALFSGEIIDPAQNQFKIGIGSNEDIDSITSEDSQKVAFVREGQLWYYDYKNVSLTQVFSFRQKDSNDLRNNYNQHKIKLLSMDKEGVISFIVYGYMNRGKHEGETGISVYEYDPAAKRIEELVFIVSNQPFETLKEEVEQVAYRNNKGNFYVMLGGQVYTINLERKDVDVLAKEMTVESCVSSEDSRYIALQDNVNLQKNNKITVYDLKTGHIFEIKGGKNNRIKALGFVNGDFIYGTAKSSDIKKKSDGSLVFPMSKVEIMNQEEEIVKVYQKSSTYILGATVNENVVELQLAEKNGKGYKRKGLDYIVNKAENKDYQVTFTYRYTTERYRELFMQFPNYVYITTVPKLSLTKVALTDDYRRVQIDESENQIARYFVYAKGKLNSSYYSIVEAINEADKLEGYVVNSKQQTMWEKNGIKLYNSVGDDVPIVSVTDKSQSKAACVAMMIQFEGGTVTVEQIEEMGSTSVGVLNSYMKRGAVNLSGATLDQVLYYVSNGSPVMAKRTDGSFLLITSYNSTLIRAIDPITGESSQMNRKEMEEEFKRAGNTFVSYMK